MPGRGAGTGGERRAPGGGTLRRRRGLRGRRFPERRPSRRHVHVVGKQPRLAQILSPSLDGSRQHFRALHRVASSEAARLSLPELQPLCLCGARCVGILPGRRSRGRRLAEQSRAGRRLCAAVGFAHSPDVGTLPALGRYYGGPSGRRLSGFEAPPGRRMSGFGRTRHSGHQYAGGSVLRQYTADVPRLHLHPSRFGLRAAESRPHCIHF